MKKTTIDGTLLDDVTGKKIKASVVFEYGKIVVYLDGYGDLHSTDGKGSPVVIDYFENRVSVIVWGDINKEDNTHIISLEGAKESNRGKG